ncbi:hypothetical protein [Actinomadura macrotermitis]|uniref:Secreted protein n=1 Tax=Actinomadura macrotermitis TaxID=2585200 RepID=A0A7K0BVM4_9ACTN|nr:hypothetical protein [Actinomadura macrotermitis]MQY05207.1 hypothetical protein [Actinomadura macrotermitis]
MSTAHDHHAAHHAAPAATVPATTGHAHHGHAQHAAPALPGGLLVAQDGYTLALETPIARPGAGELRFRVLGPDGRPVTEYAAAHGKELHLIIANRELTGFWHVHPVRDAEGTWTVAIDLPAAGAYRVLADIVPSALGRGITLGADLALAGDYDPRPLPAPARTFAVDGYEVALDGEPGDGGLTLTVRKDGVPVTDLQPYLEAYGHLVVLRAGDLAYVHVHPGGAPGDGVTPAGPEIAFHAAVPGPGAYRLFLDFKHGDVVRTAAFTAVVA